MFTGSQEPTHKPEHRYNVIKANLISLIPHINTMPLYRPYRGNFIMQTWPLRHHTLIAISLIGPDWPGPDADLILFVLLDVDS